MQTKLPAARFSSMLAAAITLLAACGSQDIASNPAPAESAVDPSAAAPPTLAICSVDDCFAELAQCVCDCGVYYRDLCPWQPPCGDQSCVACTAPCRKEFRECRANCGS